MVTQVFLVKRFLRSRRKNGQRTYRWALRWLDPNTGKFRCESTGTADQTQAKVMLKVKWAELNGLSAQLAEASGESRESSQQSRSEQAVQLAKPTWVDCRDALKRAMEADNLRPTYVADATLTFDMLHRMFPAIDSPADVTVEMANEYKRKRAEAKASPWSIKGDLATLKAIFGKWLGAECGLLEPGRNPFATVKPPKCDDPEVRIVSAAETEALFAWLRRRWNNWLLPLVYLEVAALLGWRATEIASMRSEDVLPDGYVRVVAKSSKTRRHKYGWLPPDLHQALQRCEACGWAFGRFPDELRRLLLLWKQRPHHAAKVKGFAPKRLVGWLQDELERFNDAFAIEAEKENSPAEDAFTLHDFRRTAITGLQMAGVSEKEASVMVGATPEVIRKHYEKLDQLAIARRNVERRLGHAGGPSVRLLRAGCARPGDESVDTAKKKSQTATA